MVDPAYRRRGLGRRLVEAAALEGTVVLAKGTSDAMYALRKKAGFVDIVNSEYLVCLLRPRGLGPGIRRVGAAATSLALYASLRRLASNRSRSRLSSATARFDERFDSLDARISSHRLVRVQKSSTYLKRRYESCPGRTYEAVEALDGEALRGAGIYRLPATPGGNSFLVDLLVEPSDRSAIEFLVREIVSSGVNVGIGRITIFTTCPRIRRVLSSFGFLKTASGPRFTCRIPGTALRMDVVNADWGFFHGDGDTELY